MNRIQIVLSSSILVGSSAALDPQAQVGESLQTVYWDALDESGALTGGRTSMLLPDPHSVTAVLPAGWTTVSSDLGPPDPTNRIDLVFVGDGYTAGQLGTYANHVSNVTSAFFNRVPYSTYQSYFSVHRVDVVSNESGVDNDPTQGIARDTALDMRYWCSGIDRLLCVSISKAYMFANNAPDVDLVAALANSTTYGGAGYPANDLATSAGANGLAVDIVQHEFGHALGDLADEYDYGDGATYTGGEPSDPNVSVLSSSQMAAAGTKWAAWLGHSNPAYDGLVSTFEGAMYNQFGIYRPTNNSLMRSLGRPFNLPSIEALIIEIYKIVDAIDDSSPTDVVYSGTETLFVSPMTPIGHSLAIQWYLGSQPIPGATGTTLDLGTIAFAPCDTSVSVTVTDGTSLVRDEAARAQWMTATRSFAVQVGGSLIHNYCVTSPNSVGPGAVMDHAGSNSVAADDLLLIAYGCPPNTTGLFFYGTNETQVPLGNGMRCVGSPFFRLPAQQANILGDILFPLDLDALSQAGQIHAGETWKFQCWYRNPAGGGAGTNTSDGLSVHFCP